MSDAATHPSPFYALIENGAQYELSFPCDEDGCGPHLFADGSIDAGRCTERSTEPVRATAIGNDCYRLTERCAGPLSGLGIDWGDEFLASAIAGRQLVFEKLVLPRRFVHWHIIGSAGFTNSHPFADLLHRFGGGWESIAGGMMTFTVPVEQAQALMEEARRRDILPRGLSL